MADWYISSTAYTAVAAWTANQVYNVGDIVRQLAAPAVNSERVFQCTTAGTAGATEPAWVLTPGATTTSGTAVFTEITGNAAHQRDNGVTTTWTAPAARLGCLTTQVAAGDRFFLSSDHAETAAATISTLNIGTATAQCQWISVSRAGSVPPVPADITNGATLTATGANPINIATGGWYQGLTFVSGSGGASGNIVINSSAVSFLFYFKNCAFSLASTSTTSLTLGSAGGATSTVFDNSTVQFGAVGDTISVTSGRFDWINTPSAIVGATLPTTLFAFSSNPVINLRSVDFSALAAKTLFPAGAASCWVRMSNCKLPASVTIYGGAATSHEPQVEMVNCDSGSTGFRNEWYRYGGAVTTETTITRTGGASDAVQKVSHKYLTNANARVINPLEGPVLYIWNTTTGAPVTATVEVISSAALNNDDIWIEAEYLGTTGSSLGIVANSFKASMLTTATAVPTSTAAWDSSPATPQKQKLSVSFTPIRPGLIRAIVKLAKASTTVYVDPVITLS